MTDVAAQVLATVNAPYGANLSAQQLAEMIADPKSASEYNAPVFAFFSEVSASLQMQFIAEMGVSKAKASKVASKFSQMSGHALPLAA